MPGPQDATSSWEKGNGCDRKRLDEGADRRGRIPVQTRFPHQILPVGARPPTSQGSRVCKTLSWSDVLRPLHPSQRLLATGSRARSLTFPVWPEVPEGRGCRGGRTGCSLRAGSRREGRVQQHTGRRESDPALPPTRSRCQDLVTGHQVGPAGVKTTCCFSRVLGFTVYTFLLYWEDSPEHLCQEGHATQRI